ncbi:hypothetical protein RSO41_15205 [Halomonas sp. I1]|uniref:hypothetical protein n=1 Tax=Halomonas sp. I1 TaxID=393536 RepID=UPI0028DFBB04|nr:hypothetical protein [Halomonas sp. I1]MDT8895997.1 hypothetical protein [Halomonas sp. I1]
MPRRIMVPMDPAFVEPIDEVGTDRVAKLSPHRANADLSLGGKVATHAEVSGALAHLPRD